jgi:hypothetical protein
MKEQILTINEINKKYHTIEQRDLISNINNKILFDNSCIFETGSSFYKRYLPRHLFLVTIQLNGNFVSENYTVRRQQRTLEALDDFYDWFSARFITRPHDNNSKLQPYLQLYLDDEGSKKITRARPILTPHFHGALLIHPKTTPGFEPFLQELFLKKLENNPAKRSGIFQKGHTELVVKPRDFRPIELMEIRRFDPNIGSLETLGTYITKFARNDRFVWGKGEQFELFRKYPQASPDDYPFYRLQEHQRKQFEQEISQLGRTHTYSYSKGLIQ